MTKLEKIKEAYGKFYDSYHVDENGWFDNTDHRFSDLELQELQSCDYRELNVFRPKSLEGIENNNGWIKIEDALRGKDIDCFFELLNGDIKIGVYASRFNILISGNEQFFPSEVVAWLPLEIPKKRIY